MRPLNLSIGVPRCLDGGASGGQLSKELTSQRHYSAHYWFLLGQSSEENHSTRWPPIAIRPVVVVRVVVWSNSK